MASNEYVYNYLKMKQYIKNLRRHQRIEQGRGQYSCALCRCEGHSVWNCRRYDTPKKVRCRLMELNHCRACTTDHKADAKCSFHSIFYHNRGDSCRRCGQVDHVFWTCDGMPHPGPQFEKTKGDIDKSKDKGTQNNGKKQEILDKNGPNKIIEDMKSDNLKSPTKFSNESALSVLKDKFEKMETKVESLNKKFDSVRFDMKEMQGKNAQKAKEIKDLKESVTARNAENLEKSHKCAESALDQKTKDYIKSLELKLLNRDKLIKEQEQEIQKLQCEKKITSDSIGQQTSDSIYQIDNLKEIIVSKDKSLANFEKINKTLQHNVEELINLLAKLFPEFVENIDKNMDNASFVKSLEKLIEELQSNSLKQKKELENAKTELSNEKETVKLRDKELAEQKEYFTSHKFSNKALKKLRENLIREQEFSMNLEKEYKTSINALNCQIKEIKTDLDFNKLKVEDSDRQISTLEVENKQLKESIKLSEIEKKQLQTCISKQSTGKSNEIIGFGKEKKDPADENLDQRAEIFNESAQKSAEFEDYIEGFDEQAEEYDDSAFDYEGSGEYDEYETENYEYENYEHSDNYNFENEDYYDEYADYDDCAQVQNVGIFRKMITDYKGETKSLYDLYTSLNKIELEEVIDYMKNESKNIIESLKDLEYIV